MENSSAEDSSRFDALLDRLASIKEKYGNRHPIVLFEPNIATQEKKALKDFIQGNNSIHLFSELEDALKFVQSLETSFILIFAGEYNEQMILQGFQDLDSRIHHRMPFSEEEAFLKGLFKDISDPIRKSLKTYVFFTLLDFLTKAFYPDPDIFVERVAGIKEKYGEQYPVVFYEPNIETQEKESLRHIIEGNGSIHLFSELNDGSKFIQSLGISFVLIFSSEYDEHILLQDFKDWNYAYERRMFDFEEEAFLKDIFVGISDPIRKSLKAFVLVTFLDFMTEAPVAQDEKEAMVMCDRKDMVKEFRQEFAIICYDPMRSKEAKEKLEKEIEITMEENNIYTDFGELQERIQNYTGPPYHLVLSGKDEAEKILENIDNLNDLLGFYIYCDNTQMKPINSDKFDIQKTLEELVPHIKEGIRTRSKLKYTFPAFATNFDAWDKSHIYNVHHYLKGFVNFIDRQQAKEDFIKLARKIYQDQDKTLNQFENEYNDYNKEKILLWYSKDSPVYKLINNCLRISSSDSILYCRLALKDLERAIKEEYQQKSKDFNGIVYRGAYISTDEWEKLQRNIGQEIEMYGFLSTSQKKQIAADFTKSDPKNKIFITIIIPPLPELDEQGFAAISDYSALKGEMEILFNVRSRFRILDANITKINNRGIQFQCRHLVLLYGAQSLRRYMTKSQPTILVELKLPSELLRCEECGLKSNLFGYNKEANTKIYCIECLGKNSFPKNTPLFALDSEKEMEGEKAIMKSLKGYFLQFDPSVSFPFYGYQCFDCQRINRKEYLKWITFNGQKTVKQCFECFKNNGKVNSDILISEEQPYMWWQEDQPEWEKIDSDYQTEVSKLKEEKNQGDVFLEVKNFNLCLEYGKKVLCIYKNQRCRERKKLEMCDKLGEASGSLGNNRKASEYLLEALKIRKAINGEKSSYTSASYNNLATAFENLGEYQKALEYFLKALDISQNVHGEKHPQTAAQYNNLSLMSKKFGQYNQAVEYQVKALDIRKAIYGENHPDIAMSSNNLGFVFESLGQYQQAQEYFSKALNIFKAIYGKKHPATAMSYNNLGMIYAASLGQFKLARESFSKALDIFKAIYGEKHSQTATSYNNLGLLFESLGHHQQALYYHKKALDIRKSVFGEDHPATTTSYNNLGVVYQSLRQFQQALDYYEKALDIRKTVNGENHPDTAISYNNLGLMYQNLRKHQLAQEYFLKAFDIFKVTYGENHLRTATSYSNLATVYESFRKYPEALEYHKKALHIVKAIYGEKNPHTGAFYNNIGSVYETLEQHEQAKESFLKALNIARAIFGEEHLRTATSYNNLGSVEESLGNYQQAKEYLFKARDIVRTIHGEKHPELAISYNNLGYLYQSLKQYELARDYHKKALDLFKALYGERHPHIATSYSNLALAYQSLGQNQQAKEGFLKALEIGLIIYEENHPENAISYYNLGFVYQTLEQYQEALDSYKKALTIFQVIYEEKYPRIAMTYSHLAEVSQSLGQHQQALEYQKKALDIRKDIEGENKLEIAQLYEGLASQFKGLEQYEQVLDCRKKVLDLTKVIYGENNPRTAMSCSHLAIAYQDLGQYQQGLECHQEGLDILLATVGKNHLATARSYNNIGSTHKYLQQYEQALESHEKALEIRKVVFGEMHPETAESYENIGFTYQSLGRHQQALGYHKKVLGLFQIIYGENHPETATSYENIGSVYRSLGQNSQAREYFSRALEIFRGIFGENHAATVSASNNIASVSAN